MAIRVARFLDLAAGPRPNQFTIGSHDEIATLDDLEPEYKMLLDKPIASVLGLIGNDGWVNQTAMWFDYDRDTVLVNVASHRKKVEWIRNQGRFSVMLLNPENPAHWVSMKCRVSREIHEDDADDGPRVTAQLNGLWKKYTGLDGPYGARDPAIDERRILFVCAVDRIATFGQP